MSGAVSSDVVSLEDLLAARERLHPHVRRTPVMGLRVPTPRGPQEVLFKLELLQVTGVFKVRGAFNALLQTPAEKVLACSGGNHGLAVAHAAAALGKRAIIFVPLTAARLKVEGMQRLGADVRSVGASPREAFQAADDMARDSGLPMIHPYDQAEVIAGQGTLGLELLEQAPEVRHWLMAVGGGGLVAGCSVALEGRAQIIPIEPEGCPGLFEAQAVGHPVAVKSEGCASTSLGPPSLGEVPWMILRDRPNHRLAPCVLVDEGAILRAQGWLWREARLVAEPGGATALAALMSGAWAPADDEPLGVVLCGGNADGLPACE